MPLVLAMLLVLTTGFILLLGRAAILIIDVLCEQQISLHRHNAQAEVMARRHASAAGKSRVLSPTLVNGLGPAHEPCGTAPSAEA
ncbi:MAG: hypothetical protein ACREFO_07485 [Acetobacteraceae bacterium]